VRVLVTGGTGYLGRAIVRTLAARGHEPVIFARRATAAGLPGRAIDGDVRDAAALVDAARGCEACCHSAALVSIWRRRREDFDDVNVGGLEHAIAAVRETGITRFVYTSSFLARPPRGRTDPIAANDYQRTKVIADRVARAARERGSPIVRLYPGVIYGPGVDSEGNLIGRLLRDHAAGRLPGLIGPDRIWSFSWIDDVAGAHVAALEHDAPAPEYELGGENAPLVQAFELAAAKGFKAPPRTLPYWLSEALGAAEVARVKMFGGSPLVTRGTVEIFRHDWPVGHAEAARDLAFAVTPLSTGVARTLEELQAASRRNPST
jgi:farnesol dehydrogenase